MHYDVLTPGVFDWYRIALADHGERELDAV
jgi:hypothetical protein